MKKIVILSIVLVLCVTTAAASGLDLSQYSDDQLRQIITEANSILSSRSGASGPASPSAQSLGVMATIANWEITPISCQVTPKIDNTFGSFNADDGSKFVVVNAKVKNVGNSMETFLQSFSFMNTDVSVKVVYQDIYEYSRTSLLAYDKDLSDKTMNPLTTAEGVIAFEVPNEVAESSGLVLVFSNNESELRYLLK